MSAGLVVLVLVAYIPAMNAGFIWDDDVLLTNNPLIKAPDGWWRLWWTTETKFYFPVTWTTFWLEWRLWGMNAAGYHVTNILLHAAGALLVWRALDRLAVPGAWLGALLFAVHPVNVESVAWISERKNTLALFFFVATLLCYWRAEDGSSRRWYWMSVLLFGLALLSKSTVVMLPVVLLLCAWWRRGQITSTDWVRSGPFFLLALISGLATLWFQTHHTGDLGTGGGGPHSVGVSLALIGWTFWFFLFQILAPVGLGPMYARPRFDEASLMSFFPLALLVATLLALGLTRRRWIRAPQFAVGYFLVMLFPVLVVANFLVWGTPPRDDHMLHLPMIGIVALVAAGWSAMKFPRANALAAVLVLGLGVLTWQHCRIYRDKETHLRATIDRNPRAAQAHYNLGVVLIEQRRFAEAETHLRQAIALRPRFVLAYLNWGVVLASQGRLEEAIEKLQAAERLKPHWPQIHFNLAMVLDSLGRTPDAIEHLERAVALSPDNVEARYRLGCLLVKQGQTRRATAAFREVVRQNPAHASAHYNLGLSLLRQYQPADAYRHVAEAARLNPQDPDARKLLEKLQPLRDR